MAWFRKKMWLSVEGGWAGWVDTPNSGADASPTGWGTESTFLSGGGFVDNSWGTHKRYTFEWSDASTRQMAQFMQSLRQGTYGQGLIHFVEPTLYDTNILPARVAAPHLSVEDEGFPLTRGDRGVAVSTSSVGSLNTPRMGVRFDLSKVYTGYPGAEFSTYIVIPEGYMLSLGYTGSGDGDVFVRYGGEDHEVPRMSASGSAVTGFVDGLYVSDNRAARLWIGKRLGTETGNFTVTSITARLIPRNKIFKKPLPGFGYGEQPYGAGPYGGSETTATWNKLIRGPWVGGMGHSGVRFNGAPSLVHNTGVNGGQVGFSASFIECGAWN